MQHEQLTRDLFRAYAESGMSYDLIAKTLRIGRRTAFNWRREMNLPRRTRGKGAPCHVKSQKSTATGVLVRNTTAVSSSDGEKNFLGSGPGTHTPGPNQSMRRKND